MAAPGSACKNIWYSLGILGLIFNYSRVTDFILVCLAIDFSLCSGQLDSEVVEDDVIVFISTLHGGWGGKESWDLDNATR